MYLFYLIVLTLPLVIRRVWTRHIITLVISAVTLVIFSYLLTVFFGSLIDARTIVWLLSTTLILFRSDWIKERQDRPSRAIVPILSLVLCGVIFFHFSENADYYSTADLPCPEYIEVAQIPDLLQDTREILNDRRIVITHKYACRTGDDEYRLTVLPVKNKLFSEEKYVLSLEADEIDELMHELRYVSSFYDSYVSSYGRGLGGGVITLITGTYESVWQVVMHPVVTASGIIDSVAAIPKHVIEYIRQPSLIYERPIDTFIEYLEDKDYDIAVRNGIDLNLVVLGETVGAIMHQRYIEAIGERGVGVAIAVLPFIGNMQSTTRAIKAARIGNAGKFLNSAVRKIRRSRGGLDHAKRGRLALEGKEAFYPRVRGIMEHNGYKYNDKVPGKGVHHANKPDFVAESRNEILIGESKSPKELQSSSAWRKSPKNDQFPTIREEVRGKIEKLDQKISRLQRERRKLFEEARNATDEANRVGLLNRREQLKDQIAALRNEKKIADHEIIIRGQIPDYIKKRGINYNYPEGLNPDGKVVKAAYAVSPESAGNVRKAFEACGKQYTQIPGSLTGTERVVTFVFEP
jgi:hypothetical protein